MKEKRSNLAEDFAFFEQHSKESSLAPGTSGQVETSKIPKGLKSEWAHAITKDLVRSPLQMATVYLGLSVLGYGASLAVCAQNSLGLGSWSHRVAEVLHHLPDPWCPIVCGGVFAIIPFAISSLVLNRFQQRYLMTRMWLFFASVPLVAAGVMLLLPHSLQHARLHSTLSSSSVRPDLLSDGVWMALWVATAVLLPYLLQAIVYFAVMPKRRIVAAD